MGKLTGGDGCRWESERWTGWRGVLLAGGLARARTLLGFVGGSGPVRCAGGASACGQAEGKRGRTLGRCALGGPSACGLESAQERGSAGAGPAGLCAGEGRRVGLREEFGLGWVLGLGPLSFFLF
jgi:hypothetical protein